MNQPTQERINELAAEAAHHVVESGSPNSRQHNQRTIAHAIDLAVQEERRAWGEWKRTAANGH